MGIHHTDPFATPEEDRSPVRRLRGRLVAPVTVWTALGPAGLTVSSVLVADGDPGQVLGLIDDESELWQAIQRERRFAVWLLSEGEHRVADRFGGLAPAPGGVFAQDQWHQTGYGPVLAGDRSWAGCVLADARRCGWAMLVEGAIEEVTLGPDRAAPLTHHRGGYHAAS